MGIRHFFRGVYRRNVNVMAGENRTISSKADNSGYDTVTQTLLGYDDDSFLQYVNTGVSIFQRQTFLTFIPAGFDFAGSNLKSSVTIGNGGTFTAGGANSIQSYNHVDDTVRSAYAYASFGVAVQLADSHVTVGSSTIKGNPVTVASDMTAALDQGSSLVRHMPRHHKRPPTQLAFPISRSPTGLHLQKALSLSPQSLTKISRYRHLTQIHTPRM